MAKVYWQMSSSTYEEYLTLLESLEHIHPDFEYEKYQATVERIRLLPGFPHKHHPEQDTIVPVLKHNLPTLVLNLPN